MKITLSRINRAMMGTLSMIVGVVALWRELVRATHRPLALTIATLCVGVGYWLIQRESRRERMIRVGIDKVGRTFYSPIIDDFIVVTRYINDSEWYYRESRGNIERRAETDLSYFIEHDLEVLPSQVMMEDEDINFLLDLSRSLRTQDIDAQAPPRFWTILKKRTIPTEDAYADDYEYLFYDEGYGAPRVYYYFFDLIEGIEEMILELNEYGRHEEAQALGTQLKSLRPLEDKYESEAEKLSDAFDILSSYDEGCWVVQPVVVEYIVAENTMFLTKREAQEHLERNPHKYGVDAQTHVMTASDSPQVAKLLRILEQIGEKDDLRRKLREQFIREEGLL